MKRSSKLITIILIVVLSFYITSVIVYAAKNPKISAAQATLNKKDVKLPVSYVAKVGNEVISKEEYTFFLKIAENQIKGLLGSDPVDWSTKIQNTTPVITAAEYTKQLALDNVRDIKIQLIKAKAAKLSLTKKEIDDMNANIDAAIRNLAATDIEQQKALKAQVGVTTAELKSIYKDITLVNKFVTYSQNKYKYTDVDLKKYFIDNKDELNKVTVGHILFMTVDGNNVPLAQEKQDLAKKNADELLTKVNLKDSDFAALAKQYSEDPGSKNTGGEYTLTNNHQFVPEFENWAVDPARKAGDTEIIKTDYGYHVMKFIKVFSFEELKTEIKAGFLSKKYADDLKVWQKDTKYKIVKNQSVYNSIKVPTSPQIPAPTPPTTIIQPVAPTPNPKATVDSLMGNWTEIDDSSRFVTITKAGEYYQYEDNESKFLGTFKDGVLKITIIDSEFAEIYFDEPSGHMYIVFEGNFVELKKK